MAPERPDSAARAGPTPLCSLGLTQFLRFQVPLFESSTCELEQPGESQGESVRRFGQSPGKRPQRRLDQGQALRRDSALPTTAPHTFERAAADSLLRGAHRKLGPYLRGCQTGAGSLTHEGKMEEKLGSRAERGLSRAMPHTRPGQPCWPLHCPSPGAPSPHSDRLPSPISSLDSCFPFQLRGGGTKPTFGEVLVTPSDRH